MEENLDGAEFTHEWWYRKFREDRKGHRCKVLARGGGCRSKERVWVKVEADQSFKGLFYLVSPLNVLVEFSDGEKIVGTRFCVRRRKD